MMLAMLVEAHIDPGRIDDAARAVEMELIPRFVAHPGARRAYWMANRTTGHVVIITLWSNAESLRAAEAADGAERSEAAERVGLRVLAIQTLVVFGAHETDLTVGPVVRWARAAWVEGVAPARQAELPALHLAALSEQVSSRGFRGSYWLGDRRTGNGLGLSFWEGPAELTASRSASKRRRRQLEKILGCRIDSVTEYESLGVFADLSGLDSQARAQVWPTPVSQR